MPVGSKGRKCGLFRAGGTVAFSGGMGIPGKTDGACRVNPGRLTGAALLIVYTFCAFVMARMYVFNLDFAEEFYRVAFHWMWGLSFLGLLVWDQFFCRVFPELSLLIKGVFVGSLVVLFFAMVRTAFAH